jgi:2-keto-4-pentenoate hydratase/2-oxohepta-3-ene-1,7-dioic acid hydratase in catechol pathway
MRLATFVHPGTGAPTAGAVEGEEITAYDDATALDVLAAPEPPAGETLGLAEVALLAPCQPRAIFGIGLNYAKHAAETGMELPEKPIIFSKLPTSNHAPNGDVVVPEACWRRLDYEGELAVVIGADGAIGGYAVADDLSARDLQGSEPQWVRAKGFDNSCPWGPWITTDVADAENLRLTTDVNGERRQDTSTSDLIFGPQALVDFLGEAVTLRPGDLIVTGTPSGVGVAMDPRTFLQEGDVIRIEIESLGVIEHTVRRP